MQYVKNMNYSHVSDVASHAHQAIKALSEYDSSQIIVLISKVFFHDEGKQVYVTKDVSDELMKAAIDPGIKAENVPWLGKTMEFFFEDPALPTLLVDTHNKKEIESRFQVEYTVRETRDPSLIIRSLIETADGHSAFMCEDYEHFNEYLHNESTLPHTTGAPLDTEEEHLLKSLTTLAILVCFYSSVHKPSEVSKKHIKGGRPGVKSRPRRPILKTQVLPRYEKTKVDELNTGAGKRQFKGRIPCFRCLRSEKFTHKKGQVIYVPGIPDPLTGVVPSGKRKYIIK